MNITHLEYFITAVEAGSYSSASKILYVDASTISLAISSLESEIGGPLLYRAKTGVSPTSLGKLAYDISKQIVLFVEQLKVSASANYAEKNLFSVGVSCDPQRGQVIPSSILKRVCPESCNIHFDSNSACILGVAKGYLDSAFIVGRPSDPTLHSIGLFECPTLALASFTENVSLSFEELRNAPIAIPAGFDYLFDAVTKLFANSSAIPCFREVGWDSDSIIDFLDSENGIVLISDDPSIKTFYKQETIHRIDQDLKLNLPIYYIWGQSPDQGALDLRDSAAKIATLVTGRTIA